MIRFISLYLIIIYKNNFLLKNNHSAIFLELKNEKTKKIQFMQKIDEFGFKHFGADFHTKINQNTSESIKMMMDPNMPKINDYSVPQKKILSVKIKKNI